MEFHEAANIFPMEEETIDALAESIKANGQYDAIKTYEGKILDGRRRFSACQRIGIEPRFEEFTGNDPIQFVVETQANRRNLSLSQRMMVADNLREFYEAKARERQVAAQNNNAGRAVKENFPELEKGQARDQAGAVMGVSGKAVDMARKIKTEGIPELAIAVMENRLSVHRAFKALGEPDSVQRDIASGIKKKPGPRATEERGLTAEERQAESLGQVFDAAMFARMAIAQLERISKDDHGRVAALSMVKSWVENQLI